jgi:hypothetical protein
MDNEMIFQELPNSAQNPLLATSTFFGYCKPRFRWVVTKKLFSGWLQSKIESELIRPAYWHDGTAYFSTHQVWQIHRLSSSHLQQESTAATVEFETVLQLLVDVQDNYLPEIRSNQRVGEYRDYGGNVAIGGSHFCGRTEYMLSAIRTWRRHNIEVGSFNPSEALSKTSLDVTALMRWIRHLVAVAEGINPLQIWRMLIRYSRYSKRQSLKFNALLAQASMKWPRYLTSSLVI